MKQIGDSVWAPVNCGYVRATIEKIFMTSCSVYMVWLVEYGGSWPLSCLITDDEYAARSLAV